MAQFLIWAGEDRPPICTLAAGAFSQGAPVVGDTLRVSRGGSVVGQVSVHLVQMGRMRILVDLVSGELPQAGDLLLHDYDVAGIAEVSHAPMRRGDIVDVLEDGAHPGRKVVAGPDWSGRCDYCRMRERALEPAELASGELPDFVILDVPGPAGEAKGSLAARLASLAGMPGTPRMVPQIMEQSMRVDIEDFPPPVRDAIRDNGRATITSGHLLSRIKMKRGLSAADISRRVTRGGRSPEELTNYL